MRYCRIMSFVTQKVPGALPIFWIVLQRFSVGPTRLWSCSKSFPNRQEALSVAATARRLRGGPADPAPPRPPGLGFDDPPGGRSTEVPKMAGATVLVRVKCDACYVVHFSAMRDFGSCGQHGPVVGTPRLSIVASTCCCKDQQPAQQKANSQPAPLTTGSADCRLLYMI